MATKRMLIDASHLEETRVVVLNGNRLEDFDVEVESKRQLKGNIYLAKVTRVEPSLQAAFVDYGGNRHGFLAFSEIHPDYYQIPVADREALVAEQDAALARADDEAEGDDGDTPVETVGGDEEEEVEARRPVPVHRRYKIQEVIKRRQILLVQVVKEERGNKGAALTTYLSLAGRYCVLMPNTARGGGISRKIAQGADRKRLKSVLAELDIPDGMAVIVRTAGAKRSRAEIKRDYEYLIRLWDNVREATLKSQAPALVHEEGDLIRRSIRDIYTRDIDEIVVDGDAGYRRAKDFMKLLIPSHAKKVQPHKDDTMMPLFQRYQVESQLDAMHGQTVQLRSGGYIVISPTEALVAIDVNSGRATRERNIEETALKTNLEAADEVARQVRLRDLAGLIVIDFIDMEVSRNQGRVERQLKEAMRTDRARVQIGRISPFGLLELSRQRLRPSLMETSSDPCPYCEGTGIRRSIDSSALVVLRAIEEEGQRQRSIEITVHVPGAVALYILNMKRTALAEIEHRYGFTVLLEADDSLIPPDMRIDRVKGRPVRGGDTTAAAAVAEDEAEAEDEDDREDREDREERDDGGRRKRRRRPRRKKRTSDTGDAAAEPAEEAAEGEEAEDEAERTAEGDDSEEAPAKRRRRGKRGGRRRRKTDAAAAEGDEEAGDESALDEGTQDEGTSADDGVTDVDGDGVVGNDGDGNDGDGDDEPGDGAGEVVSIPITVAGAEGEAPAEAAEEAPVEEAPVEEAVEEKPKKPRRRTRKPKAEAEAKDAEAEAAPEAAPEAVEEKPKKPRRRTRKPKAEAEAAPTEAESPSVADAVADAMAEEPAAAETPAEEPQAEQPVEPAPGLVEAAEAAPAEAANDDADTAEPEPEAPAHTKVIRVGVDASGEDGEASPRRGWWRRS